MIYTELTKKAMKIAFEAHKEQVDKILSNIKDAKYIVEQLEPIVWRLREMSPLWMHIKEQEK